MGLEDVTQQLGDQGEAADAWKKRDSSAGGGARGSWRELKVKVGREDGWRMRRWRQSKGCAKEGARYSRRRLHQRVLQEDLLVKGHHCMQGVQAAVAQGECGA